MTWIASVSRALSLSDVSEIVGEFVVSKLLFISYCCVSPCAIC